MTQPVTWILVGVICFSCVTRTSNLTYYKAFKPNRELKGPGFFYKEYNKKIWNADGTTSAKVIISPIFFYSDGTIANYFSRYFQDMNQIETEIKNMDKAFFIPEWGSYKVENDSIKIQTITKVDQSYFPPNFFDVVEWRGPIINDSTFIITERLWPKGLRGKKKTSEEVNIIFRFHKSNIKPDSTTNWITKIKN